MKFPIPDAALDDRLAVLGTAGSGKTYLATTAMERLLGSGARLVAIDPLGVMWGLRLKADGATPSGFDLPIFGGSHGDLPLTENAGALIGETVATIRESCIVDLSELPTKSAERRFMTAFLEAIYRHTDRSTDPYHLIIDEADRFAPQKPPKGDETMLNRMEEIVRRGRVRGFIPWMITQRPAVLNKNVLSQADGLVMLKLTSSQDRDQVGAWIEGQADRSEGKAILGSLPAMQRGQGVVWIPGRGILETVQFPRKTTFDSSSAPKRGERVAAKTLKPLDLGKLRDRLAKVEAETKENDPRALKAEVASLKKQLASAPKETVLANKDDMDRAQALGHMEGYQQGWGDCWPVAYTAGAKAFQKSVAQVAIKQEDATPAQPPPKRIPKSDAKYAEPMLAPAPPVTRPVQRRPAPQPHANGHDTLNGPQRRVLESVAFWKSVGNDSPTREQVAGVAGYSPTTGNYRAVVGALCSQGYLTIPATGRLSLGSDQLPRLLSASEARERLNSIFDGPRRRVVDAALSDTDALSRDELASRSGYDPSTGNFRAVVGALCTLDILTKPSAGNVAVSDWAREVLS